MTSVLHSTQVADIMLMMRQEEEPPSDFLAYTVVAVVAVAGHLMKVRECVCVCYSEWIHAFICVCVHTCVCS